ncbi:NAD-dependent epimerase/dehydratase family protein [Hyphococcus sp.]|uniref:NAD-dependent epimerase/dehydratase family protein n=1 Tax=Hyphococcus sp. TaxID=2038636 RepID=UPI0035C73740
MSDLDEQKKPVVLITGAAGGIGSALRKRLSGRCDIIGLDLKAPDDDAVIEADLTSEESLSLAMEDVRDRCNGKIDAVIHLAAYFDFTGNSSPAYEKVNEGGTRNLLHALKDFSVDRFVYSGTMLVHQATQPGERISEETPIDPKWAYPISKANTEQIIKDEAGDIPLTLLHIAGLYDDGTAVPTLSHQIARIYERALKSHVYAGDPNAGQSFIHREDLLDVLERVIDRRNDLPDKHVMLIGEPEAVSYQRLQDEIGHHIHNAEHWRTLILPKPVAKFGAALEEKSEPVVPDDLDRGEKPFIRPFMIDLASDHYALDIDQARHRLDWAPKHSILETLPALIDNLKKDPLAWYKANGITPPRWMEQASTRNIDPEALRRKHDDELRRQHRAFLWAALFNMFAGTWLLTAPALLNYENTALAWSDALCGLLVIGLSFLAINVRFAMVRWGIAAIGLWVMFAPLVFWTPSAAVYLHGTLIGALIFGFAVLSRPPPGVARMAIETGPDAPPGWDFNPSAWLQRLPIIFLAVIGLHVSRYLTAYQLGHIDAVWEPFFGGSAGDPQNGTEEIITSSVSEAWLVSDAGVGALTYMLEILTGVIGSTRRWRTMPWLVLVFGVMIVPLGVVSITFIIIQPIVIGTWCTLCLIAAAAMLLQVPYSLDELVATGGFLWRKKQEGAPVLRILFTGDSDDGEPKKDAADEFDQPPGALVKDMVGGGLTTPWNLLACIAIGIWLMLTRLTLGAEGGMANADHLIGSLVVTTSVIALAETARPLRLLNIGFGLALMITPFAYGVGVMQLIMGLATGLALIVLSFRRGPIKNAYGVWSKFII